jgi:hypothetical protein
MPGLKSVINVCVFLLFALIAHEFAMAQSEERKIEVGAQFSVFGGGADFLFDTGTTIGGGGRVTVDLTKHLALEGELNYLPSAGFNNVRMFQGQFGVKSGLRFERFGVFGKARPGFINTKYDFISSCSPFPCPPGTLCILSPCFPVTFTNSDTRVSLDVGGVLEFYSSKRITVRFDVGDTIVNRSFGTHNLQLGAGIGYRF